MPRKKTTKRKSCKVSKDCSSSAKRLRKGNSKLAAKAMNYICKPQKKRRKKKGCLNGTASSPVALISKHAKKTRKRGEANGKRR